MPMFQTACHSRIFLLYPQHHRSNHVKSTIVEIEETDAASPATAGKGLVTDNHARLRLQGESENAQLGDIEHGLLPGSSPCLPCRMLRKAGSSVAH